jgi:hypothetical protein
MNKNTKNVVAGIMLLAGAYFIYRYFKGAKQGSQPNKPLELSDFSNIPTVPVTASTFPLKKGSKGPKVVELQSVMLRVDGNILPRYGADGDFGSETEAAVLKLLGKKTVDSQADIEVLKKKINQKNVNAPFVTGGYVPSFKLGL